MEGQRMEASEMVKTSLETHRHQIDEQQQRYYQSLSERMEQGMDELDRKRSHSEAHRRKQTR